MLNINMLTCQVHSTVCITSDEIRLFGSASRVTGYRMSFVFTVTSTLSGGIEDFDRRLLDCDNVWSSTWLITLSATSP
jgi:hypothetical protein